LPDFRFPTATEFLAATSADTPWIIEPLLARGALTLFAGPPKEAGKTTLLLRIVQAVIDGGRFLGRPVVPCTAVVYATEEESTFKQALRRTGFTTEQADRLTVVSRSQVAGQSLSSVAAALLRECTRLNAGLLVLDTLGHFAAFHEGAEQDSGAMGEAVRRFQGLASLCNIAVALVTHTRKNGGGINAIRGSNQLAGAVDQTVMIRRVGKAVEGRVRALNISGRLSEHQEIYTELRDDGYIEIGKPKPVRATVAGKRHQPALKLRKAETTAASVEQLAATNHMNVSAVRRLLKDAERAGHVHAIGSGKKGDRRRYFQPGTQAA
jgi:RecA-family ATPase